MDIHAIFNLIFKFTRKRRMSWFAALLNPTDQVLILDVGGDPFNWQFLAQKPRVVLLNRHVPPETSTAPAQFEFVLGDGRALAYPNQAFEITYSNSVIEHVGTWNDQQAFAREIRRVGKKIWVQTPAWCFPIEPHYLTPFVHWIPRRLRKKMLRNFTVWGWLTRPSKVQVEESVQEIRLLTYAQMRKLFPDCEILTERFLLWPKAYIAVRR